MVPIIESSSNVFKKVQFGCKQHSVALLVQEICQIESCNKLLKTIVYLRFATFSILTYQLWNHAVSKQMKVQTAACAQIEAKTSHCRYLSQKIPKFEYKPCYNYLNHEDHFFLVDWYWTDPGSFLQLGFVFIDTRITDKSISSGLHVASIAYL